MKIQMTKILDVLKKEKGLCGGKLCGNGPDSPYPPFLGCLVGALLFATGEFTVEQLKTMSSFLPGQTRKALKDAYGLNAGDDYTMCTQFGFGYDTLMRINDEAGGHVENAPRNKMSDEDRLACVIASLESGMWDDEIALAGGAE